MYSTIKEGFGIDAETQNTTSLLSGISNMRTLATQQSQGRKITKDDLNANELKEYGSAIEYVNGEMQLNVDKVNELIETKSKEQLEVINTNKAYAQSKYAENTEKIASLRESLKTATDENVRSIEQQIDALVYENQQLPGIIENYDAMAEAIENVDRLYRDYQSTQTSSKSVQSGITNVQSIVAGQTTGKGISIEDFNSDALIDYRSALEYVNGTMQLNADKVNEIVKAKAKEQIEVNNTNKAYAQAKYLDNAGQIEKLRSQLKAHYGALANASGDRINDINNEISATNDQINALLAENENIAEVCAGYDVMSSSIMQATGAYQNWLNAQNASQSGEMFDGALKAIDKIDDTLNNAESDSYGRIGNADYKAALEFVIPDSVDSSDQEAINSYLDSISSMFTWDENGKRTGLDIENFCQKAVEQGLMTFDEASEEYRVAGGKTVEDFAEGMNLSLPLVQAMFGEMEEFGAEFTWEGAEKTLGDLGVEAYEAAEALREVDENSDLKIVMDVSGFDDKEKAIQTLDSTIKEMDKLKATPNVDASQVEYANDIIAYCVAQKREIEAPAVMSVDTSQVTGELGDALDLIQRFYDAQTELQMAIETDADTSEAQAKVDGLVAEIQGLSPEVKTTLGLDTTSVDTITTSIETLSPEMIVKAGVDSSVVEDYQKADHKSKGEVVWGNSTSAVDSYSRTKKTASGEVRWDNDTSRVKTTFTATGRVNWLNDRPKSQMVNGTAHIRGTAYLGGNWGTATGGKTLVGELGRNVLRRHMATYGRNYLIAGKPLEFHRLQRKDEMPKRECLKTMKIGQSAAKFRIGKRSTTIPYGSRVASVRQSEKVIM